MTQKTIIEQNYKKSFEKWISSNPKLKNAWNKITLGELNVLYYGLQDDGTISSYYSKDIQSIRFFRNTLLPRDTKKKETTIFKWDSFNTSWGGGCEYCYLNTKLGDEHILNFQHYENPPSISLELYCNKNDPSFSIVRKHDDDVYIKAFEYLAN